MNKVICDCCNKKEASRSFKVKKAERYFDWGKYRVIDICDTCAEKLLNVKPIEEDYDGY